MNDVFRTGQFAPDTWTTLADDQPIPTTGAVIVPKHRLLAEAESFPAGLTLGVLLHAGDQPEEIRHELHRLSLIAVQFPKFADGRGFSMARLLRERHGFTGAIRAVGDVLIDLMPLMERVGFSEFVVTHEPTRKALARGEWPVVPFFYQPSWSGDTAEAPYPAGRPWLRHAV